MTELESDEAGEGGAHQRALQPRLRQEAGEQVDVVGVLVHALHPATKKAIFKGQEK